MKRHILRAIDSDTSVRLFSDYDIDNNFYQIKEYYSDVVCDLCGRIDESRALLKPNLRISGRLPSMDLFISYDGIFVAHDILRCTIVDFDSTLLNFMPILNCNQYYAMIPKVVYEPYFADNSFVAIGSQCQKCRRYREVIGGPGIPIMHNERLTAYRLDKIVGCDFEMLINSEFHSILKSSKKRFRGVRFFSF